MGIFIVLLGKYGKKRLIGEDECIGWFIDSSIEN